ncbi:hypothetical protein CEXT_475891 [Caerostris extrusa]|uniref:Transposase n=1 Tax=Caerostris extrusa TaxID=172846 RepID=A0AAV4SNU3_CAEEX|nr:hypothetical protein CEXT_475891 [Caerostris extrusa]
MTIINKFHNTLSGVIEYGCSQHTHQFEDGLMEKDISVPSRDRTGRIASRRRMSLRRRRLMAKRKQNYRKVTLKANVYNTYNKDMKNTSNIAEMWGANCPMYV